MKFYIVLEPNTPFDNYDETLVLDALYLQGYLEYPKKFKSKDAEWMDEFHRDFFAALVDKEISICIPKIYPQKQHRVDLYMLDSEGNIEDGVYESIPYNTSAPVCEAVRNIIRAIESYCVSSLADAAAYIGSNLARCRKYVEICETELKS